MTEINVLHLDFLALTTDGIFNLNYSKDIKA
jgi:hypothetical protein